MPEKLLDIKNLRVVYKTDNDLIYAVNGVDLSLEKGEVLGLVGETGAGKSTIALSIMKLLPAKVGSITDGSITFDNKNLIDASEADMRAIRGNDISMIFSDPMSSLNPLLTVGDQIAEVIEMHEFDLSSGEIRKKVDDMLELVGIPHSRKHEYPHQFSGGMRQRIVIAMALACNPRLILADEPTTALDVTIQAQVLKTMNELKEKMDTAMILITHDLGVVAQMCDTVAIVYAGEIIEYGTAEMIFEGKDHHPYTVGLFNSIPDIKSKARRLSPIDGLMPDPAQLPKGCRFAERCRYCRDVCREKEPGTHIFDDGHMIKCFLFERKEAIGRR
ncbi:MAG: ABC transporter ATP-binding protein [Clostridiales bacterium]|nr:ABC transporter ATP-binding protein [Clostridiales bacterium]